MEINYPDFKALAEEYRDRRDLSVILEVMFKQGYHLGLNKGWAYEQDQSQWADD